MWGILVRAPGCENWHLCPAPCIVAGAYSHVSEKKVWKDCSSSPPTSCVTFPFIMKTKPVRLKLPARWMRSFMWQCLEVNKNHWVPARYHYANRGLMRGSWYLRSGWTPGPLSSLNTCALACGCGRVCAGWEQKIFQTLHWQLPCGQWKSEVGGRVKRRFSTMLDRLWSCSGAFIGMGEVARLSILWLIISCLSLKA